MPSVQTFLASLPSKNTKSKILMKQFSLSRLSRRTLLGAMLSFGILGVSVASYAQTIVAPNIYTNANSDIEVVGAAGTRHQQIFSSTQFWPAGETHTIHSLAFRPGKSLPTRTYTWTLSNIEVYVSTTSKTVAGLSPTFVDNYASSTDRTLVYRGPITFSTILNGSAPPHNFDFRIPFQVPFSYTPANGNLLVDIVDYSFTENLWNAQVDAVLVSDVTNYVMIDYRYPTGRIGYFGGAGVVMQFGTDYIAPSAIQPIALTLSPTSLIGGASSLGTVMLNAPAPVGGLSVALGSNTSFATLPASLFVPAGQSNASFTVSTTPVTSQTTANITATLNGGSVGANLTINPSVTGGLQILQFTLDPKNTLETGEQADGTIVLSAKAPTGGVTILLNSSNPAALSCPATVTVPAGQKKIEFKLMAGVVSQATPVTIHATLIGSAKQASIIITPR
jgi:hypothetical protein